MSKPKTITTEILSQDIVVFDGLKTIKNYKPSRADLSTDSIEKSYQKMREAQLTTRSLQNQQKAAESAQKEAELDFHCKIRDMKDSVRGQFGSDSHEITAIGLTRLSERKPPKPRKEK